MRKLILIIVTLSLLVGFATLSGMVANEGSSSFAIGTVYAQQFVDSIESDKTEGGTSFVLRGGLFVLGLMTIIYLFYSPVYRLLLHYYHPDDCKRLTWPMIMLYSVCWFAIGLYIVFDYGLYFFWIKWVFAFLGSLWLIWFLVMVFRKPTY